MEGHECTIHIDGGREKRETGSYKTSNRISNLCILELTTLL